MPRKKVKLLSFEESAKNHVALKLAYLGMNYDGVAFQENTQNTVEQHLFDALIKTHFIDDRTTCSYSRSGRTDKGVSALGNCLSLNLRSRQGHDLGEYNYAYVLNSILPPDIRILGHVIVPEYFDARFSCLYREYRYYFSLDDMNLDSLKDACQRFVGYHDFRNFCKLDIVNVKSFKRRILSFNVEILETVGNLSMCMFRIKGFSYLWHQVRCMVSVLFMIGKGLEPPSVIDELLDVEKRQRKPHYDLAPEYPLILYDCVYERVQFVGDSMTLAKAYKGFQEIMMKYLIQSIMINNMLKHIDTVITHDSLPFHHHRHSDIALTITKKRNIYSAHIPLLSRNTMNSYEERLGMVTGRKAKILNERKRPSD